MLDVASDRPMRFAYADPPYPGKARKYYQREPTFAGEVDHPALIAELRAGGYDGWALSTAGNLATLRALLPLCPDGARLCPWVKPHPAAALTYGLHNVWEAVIVVGGRQRRPGVRDAYIGAVARGGGSRLVGRKPLGFCAWLFRALGMQPGDELVDLFPGSGNVSRAWRELASPRTLAT